MTLACEQIVGFEAQVHSRQMYQAADQKPCSDQENDGDRYLEDNQSAAKPRCVEIF